MGSIRDFRDLEIWEKGRKIRKRIYEITRDFPIVETYGLSTQMRKAAISVTANIAEGFGRNSWAENKRFSRISRGSAFELQDHLSTAYDEGYISQNTYREIDHQLTGLIQMLNAYIRSMRKREPDTSKRKTSTGNQ